MTFPLHSLFKQVGIELSEQFKNLLIENFTHDSRRINKGELFFGLPGEKIDGGCFWRQAISDGAVAAVIGSAAAELDPPGEKDLVIVVPDPVAYWMGELASVLWDKPSFKMDLIGVTGTNGKTTTSHLIEHLSSHCGRESALFGTLYNRWPQYSEVATHTTAFGDELQRKLAKAVNSGANFGVMEVSSHALTQRRVAGCHFSGAIFTNLTHEHLDYHNSMEAYFEAKSLLFKTPYLYRDKICSVINIDDPWGLRLSKYLQKTCWRSSLDESLIESLSPELFLTHLKRTSKGMEGILHSPLGNGAFCSPLIGRFNLMNLLQAVGALLQQGLPLEELLSSINSFPGVPGRMEKIKVEGHLPEVVVDYAHTPDGLKNALKTLRTYVSGTLLCVFGCGGDRDRKKRPEMGAIASELADRVILTSDNPRTEDPHLILKDILSGIPTNMETFVEVDRAIAIQKAILMSVPGDMVLIAGKGHEDYQIIGMETIQFDDREIAKTALNLKLNS